MTDATIVDGVRMNERAQRDAQMGCVAMCAGGGMGSAMFFELP